MRTKAKLSTKVLSFFLSALMAASCFGIALPNLAPAAKAAAATADQWQALQDALDAAANGGYLSTDDYTVSVDADGNASVNDTTKNGYLYAVVRAVGEIAVAEGTEADHDHNATLAAYIAGQVNANEHQTAFITAILPNAGKYAEYGGNESAFNGTDLSALPATYTFTTTVTRDVKGAVLTDYASAYDVPATVGTTYKVTFSAERVDSDSDLGADYTRAYYKNAEITSAVTEANAPDLTAIKNYLNFVNGEPVNGVVATPSAFANGYAAWQADKYSIYNEDPDVLQARYTDYTALYSAVNGAGSDGDYIELFIGADLMNSQLNYANQCGDASAAVRLKSYVDWINGAPPAEGVLHKDNYSPTDRIRMENLIAQAQNYMSNINAASDGTKALLKEVYGYLDTYVLTTDTAPVSGKTYYSQTQSAETDPETNETYVKTTYVAATATTENISGLYELVSYENYIQDLQRKVALYNLADIRTAALYLIQNDASHTYVFPAGSRFSTYTQTADTAPVAGKTYYAKDIYGSYAPAAATAENITSLYEAEGVELQAMGSNNYYSEAYIDAGETCPVGDLELNATSSWINSAYDFIGSSAYKFEVFTQAEIDEIRKLRDNLKNEIAYRVADDASEAFRTEYAYFVNLMLNTDISALSNDVLMGYTKADNTEVPSFILTVNTHYNTLNSEFNSIAPSITNTAAKQQYQKFVTNCRDYVDKMAKALLDRCYDELIAIYKDANKIDAATSVAYGATTNNYSIDKSNFSLVRGGITNFDEDRDTDGFQNKLYDWLIAKKTLAGYEIQTRVNRADGSGSGKYTDITRIYNRLSAYLEAAQAQVVSGWGSFSRAYNDHVNYSGGVNGTSGYIQNRSGNGTNVYTVRDGRADDMVRADNDKDYVVNTDRMNAVITKLDTFAASAEFVKLIGVYDASQNVTTLKGFLNNLLQQNLFSQEMANTFVAMLFPMLKDLIQVQIVDMLKTKLPGNDTPVDGRATACINLQRMASETGMTDYEYQETTAWGAITYGYKVYLSELEGRVDVAVNGDWGTRSFKTVFQDLGVNVYPSTLASYLNGRNSSGKYSTFINKLNSCGDDWMAFDRWGNNNGEVDKDDFALLGFNWGITNYNTFVSVMGDIFGAAGPIIHTLFTNHTFAANVSQLVFVKIYGGEIPIRGTFAVSASTTAKLNGTEAWGSGSVTIDGIQGYNQLWAPIMEGLGLTGTVSNYNVTQANPFSTTIGVSGQDKPTNTVGVTSGCTTAQLVNALFQPLMSLVDKLSDRPIDTVLGILPNIAYNIAFNNVKPLLNVLQSQVHVRANVDIEDLGSVKARLFNMFDIELNWLASLFEGTIEGLINDNLKFDIPLVLSEMIDIESILPFDITNLNDILKFVLSKVADDDSEVRTANIPAINTGRIGMLGEKRTRTVVRSGFNYIEADKADVLYELIQLVMNFAGQSGNLSGLIARFSGSGLGEDIDSILSGIDTDKALAALVELFVPQTYKMATYNWYQANSNASTYTFNNSFYSGTLAQGGFVYMKYSNNWTREKAQYMYDNLEKVADDIFGMIDSEKLAEYEGFSDWLLKTINKMFRNKGINDVVNGLVKLGKSLDSEGKMLPNMLKDQLKVNGQGNVDIYSWYYRFGYLNPELRTLGSHEVSELDPATGQVVTRTVNEVLYVDQHGNICVGYPENTTAKIDGADVPVVEMHFVRTYPLAPSGFAGFTTNEDGDKVPAASGSNLPGRYNQANITYYYSPKYATTSTKRYDNYATCNVSADGQYSASSFTCGSGTNARTFENKNKASDLFTVLTPVILTEPDEDGNIIQWKVTGNANTAQFGVNSGLPYTLVDGELGTESTAVNAGVTARAIFTAIFASLIEPLAPAISFILNGKDLNLFNSALTVKGYDVYNGALVPLLEALGVNDLLTSAQYNSTYGNNATGGFYYLTNKVFAKLTDILSTTNGKTPTQKIIDLLPGLYYYLQSDGLSTLLKNVLFPIWVLVDDVRPLADLDLNAILKGLAGKLLNVEIDPYAGTNTSNPIYNLLMGLLNLDPILTTTLSNTTRLKNAIMDLNVKDLSLKAIAELAGSFTGMYLQPLFYAFEGMCYGYKLGSNGQYSASGTQYGVVKMTQSSHNDMATYNSGGTPDYSKNYTLKYLGPDVITVTISAVLDLLRYQGNAQALDEMIGLARELLPGETLSTAVTATGLLNGLEKVFAARANDNYTAPNWAYMLDGKLVTSPVDGNTIVWSENLQYTKNGRTYKGWEVLLMYSNFSTLDLHNKHDDVTKRALAYKTDWTRETAVDMETMFATLLDWVTTSFLAKDDDEITGFKDYIDGVIDGQLLGAKTLKSLAGLIAKLYNTVPASIIAVVDNLLGTDLTSWMEPAEGEEEAYIHIGNTSNKLLDENGQPVLDENDEFVYEEAGVYYVDQDFKWWALDKVAKLDDNNNPIVINGVTQYEFKPYGEAYVDSRDEFFDALTKMITPVASLFGFIFLEDGYKFFYTAGNTLQPAAEPNDDNDAIILEGLGIWGKGMIPLLEAMGIRKMLEDKGDSIYNYEPGDYTTTTPGVYDSEGFVADFIYLLRVFAEGVVADPVAWLLDNLPNVIYFINAGGVSTAVKNIFDSIEDILEMVNTQVDANDQISTANLAGINLSDLTLDGIFKLVEKYTAWTEGEGDDAVKHPGLHVRDDLVQYIKDLYFGSLSHYTSANGKDAFRMDALPTVHDPDDPNYDPTREDRANFITVFVALLLEIAEDKGEFYDTEDFTTKQYDNPAAIDALAKTDGLISQVIDAVKNPQVLIEYKNINWKYFDENVNLANVDDDGKVLNVPGYLFVYLNYTTKWTYDKALATATGLEDMVLSILDYVDHDKYGALLEEDDEGHRLGLGGLINTSTFYNGEVLQSLLDLLAGVLFSEDALIPAEMLEAAGALLGADFSEWAVFDSELESWTRTYAFGTEKDFEGVTVAGTEFGLSYATLPAKVPVLGENGKQLKDEDGNKLYTEGDPIKTYLVNDRDSFVAALTLMLKPAYRLLDWLLFNDSYEFFNGNTAATQNDVLITLPGCEGYKNGLVLLLEALGCEGLKYASYYETEDGVNTEAYVSDILTSVANRIDNICANPVDALVGLIPELIYFINAGGLQVSVANLLAGPLALVNNLKVLAGDAGDSADADAVVNKLVGDAIDKALADYLDEGESANFTLNGINLQYIFEIVELITGLEITDCVGNKLNMFYMGEIYRYNSMCGQPAYKMIFSNEEDFADFITIMVSLVIDVLLWEDDSDPEHPINNAQALLELIDLKDNETFTAEEMRALILEVIEFLKDGYLEPNPRPIDWLYFDETKSIYDANDELKETLPTVTPDTQVNVPDRFINYLTYASDWTDDLAHYIYNNRNDLVASVLKMAKAEDAEVLGIKIIDLFNGNVDPAVVMNKLYTAQNLNKILAGIQNLTTKVPAALFDLLYIVLDMNFSAYDESSPNFIGYFDETANDGILTKEAFINGLYTILSPLSTILDWLLFGKDLEYFDKKDYSDGHIDILLKIAGAKGYDEGLIPIMEALGIEATASTAVSTTANTLKPVLTALLTRVEEILTAPVDEILALLPNLLYFINTRGLITSVQNLLMGPMALLDRINANLPADKQVDINLLLSSVLDDFETEVDIFKLDLKGIFTLVEDLTGLQIIKLNADDPGFIDAAKIENFYFGKIELSRSANGKVRGTMSYTAEEDAADMLTIIVNLAVELALYEWDDDEGHHSNAAVIEGLIEDMEPGTITGIIEALDALAAEVAPGDYHWNYFNEVDGSFDPADGYTETFYYRAKEKNLFLNYLTYDPGQSWTQETAQAVYGNLGTIIDKVLTVLAKDDPTKAATLSELIHGSFNLYTAENLNKILGYIDLAYGYIDELVDLIGLVLGADLSGWQSMARFTDAQITDRETFRAALVEVIKPLYPVLDWLLFGKNYEFFVRDANGNALFNADGVPVTDEEGNVIRIGDALITLNGSDGYAFALVPLLTILGVDLPECTVGVTTCGTEIDGRTFLDLVIDAVLTRLDEILDNPVDEALALLPQLLYFVNANGAATMVDNLLGAVKNAADVLMKNGVIPLPEGTEIPADGYVSPENVAEYVYDLAGIDINNLDLEGIIAYLEGMDFMKGLKINEAFTREDYTGDGILDNILEYFYMGAGAQRTETSVKYKQSEEDAAYTTYAIYMLKLEGNENGHNYVPADTLTTLLCIVLEVLMYENDDHTANAQPIADIVNGFSEDLNLEASNIEALRTLLREGATGELADINWAYVFNPIGGEPLTAEQIQAKVEAILAADTTALNELPERTVNYLTYDAKNNAKLLNLWSEDAVQYVDDNLNDIVDRVINLVTKGESEDLNALIKNNLDIFSDDIANKLVGYLVNALGKLDELLGGEETTDYLLDTVGALLGEANLSELRNAKAEGIQSKEEFVNFLVETLDVLNPVLDWLLFGKDYRFFTNLDGENAGKPHTIIIKGGEGYKYGLAPILDALGVSTEISEEKAATALREVLMNVADRIEEILDNPIDEVLDLLPELIYFINANGLTVCANNLIAPIDALLKAVGPEIGMEDLSLNKLITAVDLDNLNFSLVYDILADKTGIILNDEAGEPIGKYLSTFYFGELQTVTIYDDLKGVHMVYTDRDARYDMVTIIVTLLLDVIVYEGNKTAIVDLLKNVDENKAEPIYNAVIALLTHNEKTVSMVPYNWILTEYDVNGSEPEAGKIVCPADLGATLNHSIYGPLYTREMGAYITKFFPLFVDTYITLLGIEGENGVTFRSLDELLDSLIGESIYKTSLLQSVAGAISNAIAALRDTLGDEMFNYAQEVLERSLNVDLDLLLNMEAPEIEEGDREGFVNAICEMLSPVAPILRWLLTDQDIALFTDRDGEAYIVLEGAKGYQDSIIPIMEALHVPADSILTQAEYEAATDRTPKNEEDAAKDAAMLTNIINPILDRVDEIIDDPLNQIFDVLPALVYFVNSKGLDSAFKNALNAVYRLLETIDPAIADIEDLHKTKNGETYVSLYPLMSKQMAALDLEELTFETIADLLVELVNSKVEDYGFELTGVLKDAIAELSCGIVRSFDSKRARGLGKGWGDPDYTMDYAGTTGSEGEAGDKVDMATIVMRLALHFISYPENVIAIEKLLEGKLNEDGYKFLCSLLENFQGFAYYNNGDGDGMDKIMYTVYYIFYAALNAGVATNNGLAEFNGNYSFLNQLFATSEYSFLNQLAKSFGDLLNKWTGDIVDEDEVAPKGFIKLFKSLIEFFQKILRFFKNLFGVE